MLEPATPETTPVPQGFRERMKARYARIEPYVPASFFVLGFVFDVVTLGRIDDLMTILTQAGYLAIIALFLGAELVGSSRPLAVPRGLQTIWKYKDEIVHFIFGSLLSAYALFYFKSSSFVASFSFLLLIAVLMVANEFSRFQQAGALMRVGLLSLCLVSYFAYVIPVIVGFIGYVPFLAALAVSALLIGLFTRVIHKLSAIPETPLASTEESTPLPAWKLRWQSWKRKPVPVRARHVGFVVLGVFLLLYILQIVPPVPLSAQYMGIYHNIEKSEGKYRLSYDRPWWKFWQKGAQTFLARPGDRIYVFARVFSPAHFQDEIRVRWVYKDKRHGWSSSDAIPIKITGGRDEGFRGFAYKQNYTPGDWRVQLETTDGREIGRIGFTVVTDDEIEERVLRTDVF